MFEIFSFSLRISEPKVAFALASWTETTAVAGIDPSGQRTLHEGFPGRAHCHGILQRRVGIKFLSMGRHFCNRARPWMTTAF